MNYFHEKLPEVGQKFVAINDDGCTANIFIRMQDVGKSVVYLSAEGEVEYDLEGQGYFDWLPLHNDFMLWFEAKNK